MKNTHTRLPFLFVMRSHVQILALEKENDYLRSRLGGDGRTIPAWVKPNRPERKKKDRKKRQMPKLDLSGEVVGTHTPRRLGGKGAGGG